MENLSVDIGTKIQWSSWSRCESSFSMLLVPHRPGVLALAEEIIESAGGKRMLALFFVCEARDLSTAVSAMFSPGSQLRARLEDGRCYVRYAMISDPEHRREVCAALETWMATSAEMASGVSQTQTVAEPVAVNETLAEAAEHRTAVTARTEVQPSAARPAFPAGF